MDRLPDIYHLLFYREGVIDEVVRLSENISISESSDELSEQSIQDERLNDLFEGLRRFRKQVEYNASKQPIEQSDSDENDEFGALYKRETNPEAHSSQSSQIPREKSKTRIKSEEAFGGMRTFERISISLDSRYLGRVRGKEVKTVDDIRKWLHMKSSKFRTNYIDNIRQNKERNFTKGIFSNLQALALQLKGDIIDPLAVDTLVALTEYLKTTEESMTSFEFLQSGLMVNLLEYLTNPHYSLANLSKRQLAFLEIFVGGTHASLTEMDRAKVGGNIPKLGAFSVLVKKLQQSLTQLEPFEVALSYQDPLNEKKVCETLPVTRV
ncbi:Ubiquitin fusion degradation protein 4 [Basidiobolus ranarum]|uniref:Ubiquitin fusion degradation protein 4 n=1 Tax=Basidiobolus ranarum TaxID=34480 RepID=A0ABR2VJ83_9FUNG